MLGIQIGELAQGQVSGKDDRLGSRAGLGAWPLSVGQVLPTVVINLCCPGALPSASLRAASPSPAPHLCRGHRGLEYVRVILRAGARAGARAPWIPRGFGLL